MFGAVANAYFAAFEDGQPEAARHVIDFPLLLALEVAPALIQAMVSVPSVRIPLSPPRLMVITLII